MSRKKRVFRRESKPDIKYGNVTLGRLINKIMIEGKKSTAERIVYDTLDILEKKMNKKGMEVFDQALNNIKPEVEVKSRRIGGATYQIPVEVPPERAVALAILWLITYARNKKGRSMSEKLAAEISDAYNNTGASIKKREDTHKMAEANRAFAHFIW
ncbi:MAG: 30S ribosomal protein S7 [bacterium]|nr:30S ribosomal protein S7 [bacterium]